MLAIAHRRDRGGFALLYVLLMTVAIGGLLTAQFAGALSTSSAANTRVRVLRAEKLAEAGLAHARLAVAEAVANWEDVPASGTALVNGVEVEWTASHSGLSQSTVTGSGLITWIDGYVLEARGRDGFVRRTARDLLVVEVRPAFQYAVFYTEDLEIFPGPNMNLQGRVHTNGDLYVGCGNTLTLDTNYVHAVGELSRSRKDNPDKSDGTVSLRCFVDDPYDAVWEPEAYWELPSRGDLEDLGIASESGYDSSFTAGYDANGDEDYDDPSDLLPYAAGALEYTAPPEGYSGGSGSTLSSVEHGIAEAKVPSVGSIAIWQELEGGTGGNYKQDDLTGDIVPSLPGEGTHEQGYYHSNADLVILTHSDGSWTATSQGVDVTVSLRDVVEVTSMYDARQASGGSGEIQVTDIDMEALGKTGYFPENGLLYAGVEGVSTGTNAAGVRLKNGAELHDSLTVASENSVYVWGDYNTTNKVGASVITDAINLLSNDWDDSKTSSGLPTAASTTYNVAVVTGNQKTVGSAYNGGLENLPRFHENWSGKAATIDGSFISLWESQYATGKWQYGGNRYTAPVRDWHYDTDFNDASNLPPYWPRIVDTRRVASF